MSPHKTNRETDNKPSAKKSSNGASSRQRSGDNKNIEIKYTKGLEDGGSKKNHQFACIAIPHWRGHDYLYFIPATLSSQYFPVKGL